MEKNGQKIDLNIMIEVGKYTHKRIQEDRRV